VKRGHEGAFPLLLALLFFLVLSRAVHVGWVATAHSANHKAKMSPRCAPTAPGKRGLFFALASKRSRAAEPGADAKTRLTRNGPVAGRAATYGLTLGKEPLSDEFDGTVVTSFQQNGVPRGLSYPEPEATTRFI
jgi:hypothetical protein